MARPAREEPGSAALQPRALRAAFARRTFAACLESAIRVRFGRCAMVRFRFAAPIAFRMFRRAAARCFSDAIAREPLRDTCQAGLPA